MNQLVGCSTQRPEPLGLLKAHNVIDGAILPFTIQTRRQGGYYDLYSVYVSCMKELGLVTNM